MQQQNEARKPNLPAGFPPGFDVLTPPLPLGTTETYWIVRASEWATGVAGFMLYDVLGDAVFLPDDVAAQASTCIRQALLSVFQQRTIFRAMVALARERVRAGASPKEVRGPVGQLRDQLAQAALTDIAARLHRRHLR